MRAPALLALFVAVSGCGSGGEPSAAFRVPRPALEGVDPEVRRQLEERAAEVETLLAQQRAGATEAATAIGELGRYYHAYDLTTDAALCYREAIRLAPRADWHYYLGFLSQVRGDLAAAASSLSAALELEPEDPAARVRLADVLAALGRGAEAERHYSEAAEQEATAAAARRGLGRLAAEGGRHRAAVEHFEAALRLQPRATALHHPLAQAYRALGDDAAADRHAALAGTGQVGFPDPRVAALDDLAVGAGVRLARGGVALAEGNRAAAIEEYRRAVAAAPDNPAARANLGMLLASAGERVEAREQLGEAVALEPENLEANLALAQLLAVDGELDAALEAFDRVLELSPGHLGARRGRAAVLVALGDGARARPDLEAVVDATPDDAAARLQLGSLLQASGDAEGAERHYRAALALELEPGMAAAGHLSLGNLRAGRGALEAALESFEAALEHVPELREALYNRAGVLARLGRFGDAAAAYRRFLELEPGHDGARFYLGDALLRSGDPSAAVEVFSGIEAGDPHHERARLGVAVGLKRMGRAAEAVASLEASLTSLPRSGALAHELALTLASASDRSLRDGERAVELAGRLYASQPSPLHAETLAMALAEAGHFDQAVDLQGRLVDEAAGAGDVARAERLRAVLELYRGGEACCPPPS